MEPRYERGLDVKNAFFAMVSRMRYINRWALMRNTRTENIEEHSLQVAVLAHAIALIRTRFFPLDGNGQARIAVDPDRVAVLAVYHDAGEILVGDMPTPIKYFNADIERAFKSIEKDAVDKLTGMLPPELRGDYTALMLPDRRDPVIDEAMRIVKAADKISALIKCIEEEKAGNTEFVPASRKLRIVVEETGLPEVDYFVRHFLPAYGRTLDELEEQPT